jgi:hypothetical protein
MSKKYLILGGPAAARLKTLSEEDEIIIPGGFISVGSYEYYRDLTTGREPIV